MKVRKRRKTCSACPSQWEGRTDNDRPVYVRYRWGHLSVRVGPPAGDMDSATMGYQVLGRQIGDAYDGTIKWSKVKHLIEPIDVEDAVSLEA